MPSISNLHLTIERNSQDTAQTSPRSVNVSFTTNFSATEMFAHVVYKAEINLKSQTDGMLDNDPVGTIFIGTRIITSSANHVQTSITTSIPRRSLDEDFDYRIVNGTLQEVSESKRDDEWIAEVKLTPVVFATVTAQSPQVVGSWGVLGQD